MVQRTAASASLFHLSVKRSTPYYYPVIGPSPSSPALPQHTPTLLVSITVYVSNWHKSTFAHPRSLSAHLSIIRPSPNRLMASQPIGFQVSSVRKTALGSTFLTNYNIHVRTWRLYVNHDCRAHNLWKLRRYRGIIKRRIERQRLRYKKGDAQHHEVRQFFGRNIFFLPTIFILG